MARQGEEAEAEPLQVVIGIVQDMGLQLAIVAGAGIDLPTRQAAAQASITTPP
jgi:hypothetical protein